MLGSGEQAASTRAWRSGARAEKLVALGLEAQGAR